MEGLTASGLNLGDLGKIRQLLLVTPALLPRVWSQLEPLFLENSAAWKDYYTIESIAAAVATCRMQLWTMNDEDEFLLAAVTEIVCYPCQKVMNILILVGSEMRDGLERLEYIELWGRRHGVDRIVLIGRKGFLRALAPYGYKAQAIVLTKDITGLTEH